MADPLRRSKRNQHRLLRIAAAGFDMASHDMKLIGAARGQHKPLHPIQPLWPFGEFIAQCATVDDFGATVLPAYISRMRNEAFSARQRGDVKQQTGQFNVSGACWCAGTQRAQFGNQSIVRGLILLADQDQISRPDLLRHLRLEQRVIHQCGEV